MNEGKRKFDSALSALALALFPTPLALSHRYLINHIYHRKLSMNQLVSRSKHANYKPLDLEIHRFGLQNDV